MKQVRLDRFGLETKKKEEQLSLDNFDQPANAKRGYKAKRIGQEIEELVMKRLKLKKNREFSPDLIGHLDGKPVGIEVKHSTRNDVIIWYKQLIGIHNWGKNRSIEGMKVNPYYGLVFTKKDGKRVLYLVPTEELISLAESKGLKKTMWGIHQHKKEKIEKVEKEIKNQWIHSAMPEEKEEITKSELNRLKDKLQREHFRLTESEAQRIAKKVLEL